MLVHLLLDDDSGIPIPVDDCIRQAWLLQHDRACQEGGIEGFRKRLAACFAMSLAECLDADLKPPTPAQVHYATAIGRELGVSLPAEALRFRGAMTEFITRFDDVLRQKRQAYLQNVASP